MKDTPLAREWRHADLRCRMPDSFYRTVRALWDSISVAVWHEMISCGPVVIEGSSYQPHEDGKWAFLTPVLHIDGDEYRSHVWFPPLGLEPWSPALAWERLSEVVDIVAWHPATPGRWAHRTGVADMLGYPYSGDVLRVHQTPLGWLRSGCEGVCFLEQPAFIGFAERIVADSPAHARELRAAFEQRIPRIVAA